MIRRLLTWWTRPRPCPICHTPNCTSPTCTDDYLDRLTW